jgi:hypothetical protein
MDGAQLFTALKPLLEAGLERVQRFKDPQPKDVVRFFEPALLSACLLAQVPDRHAKIAARYLSNVALEDLDLNSLRATIEGIALVAEVRDPGADRLAQVEAERTGLDDRTAPINKRSRDSILRELWEIRTGTIREKRDGRWSHGERLPAVVWGHMAADNREEKLQAELDSRDLYAYSH